MGYHRIITLEKEILDICFGNIDSITKKMYIATSEGIYVYENIRFDY